MKNFSRLIIPVITLFAVSCNKKDNSPGNASLSVSRNKLSVGNYQGFSDTISIQSTIDWKAAVSSGASSWLSVDKASGGTGSNVLKISVNAANTSASQTATITITPGSGNLPPQVINITQPVYNLVWQKVLGGSQSDDFNYALQTSDGGYFALGNSNSPDGDVTGFGGGDAWFIRTDGSGTPQWHKVFGGTYYETGNSAVATKDGGLVVTGLTDNTDGDSKGAHGYEDIFVAKFDATGNIIWKIFLGGSGSDIPGNIIATPDGGYLVGGATSSFDGDVTGNHGGSDIWVIKLDANGNKSWNKTFGGSANDYDGRVAMAPDGGYYLSGSVFSKDGDGTGNHGNLDAVIFKLDANGNKVWSKLFGGSGSDYFGSIITTSDGGCILAGSTNSNDGDISGNHSSNDDFWVLKLDNTGKKQWQSVLGGTADDDATGIQEAPGGNYIVAGLTGSTDGDVTINHGGNDAWVVGLNATGQKLWQRSFGSTGNDIAASVFPTTDGGFLFSGCANGNNGDVSGMKGQYNGWLFKLK